MKFEWEQINNNENREHEEWWEATYRSKVFGGWIVRHECAHEYVYYDEDDPIHMEGEEWNKRDHSMVFIPDPNHEWTIDK